MVIAKLVVALLLVALGVDAKWVPGSGWVPKPSGERAKDAGKVPAKDSPAPKPQEKPVKAVGSVPANDGKKASDAGDKVNAVEEIANPDPANANASKPYEYLQEVGCYGPNIRRHYEVKSPTECEEFCNARSECTAFTYVPEEEKCYLKYNCCPYTRNNKRPGWTSGQRSDLAVPCRDGEREYSYSEKKVCNGEPLGYTSSTTVMKSCRELCEAIEGCGAFTLEYESDEPCTLYKDCKKKKNGNAISGIAASEPVKQQ